MLRHSRTGLGILLAVSIFLTLSVHTVLAKEYIYGSWNSPKNVVITKGVAPYLKRVEQETGGSMTWKILAGGQLFGGRANLAGIRDKIADAGGPVIPAFTRKELRAANVVYDLVNASESPVVMAGAVAETYHLDCPECKADFAKNNTVFIANYSTPRFNVLCKNPVNSMSDLKGLKIRVVGAFGRFIKAAGGVPVGGSPAKAVQAVQRGRLDCIFGPISWLESFGMWGIAHHVYDAPFALQPTPSSMVINRDTWKGLSRAERSALIKHAPALVAETTINGYMAEDREVRRAAAGKGVTIKKAGSDALRALAVHKKKELTIVPEVAKKEGVKNAGRIVKAHLKNVAKWEKIHQRIGDDPKKFADALWREVFSKLDPETM